MSIGNKIHLSTFVILIVLILGAQLVLVNNLLAQDLTKLYVDAAADTAAADGTEAHPYPGIDLACQVAENGATILVKPGTYGNSNISAPRPSNLTIQSTDGPETTIIDGSKTADASFGIVIRAGSGWTVDGFTFINIGGVVSSGYSCGVYNDNRVGGETDTSVVNVVRNCVFKEAEIRGIWVQKGTKVLIEHNYFENTGANAVLSYGFVDFYNNTVVATDTLSPYGDNSGVYQAGDGGSDGVMTVKNNIFVDNYVGMIRAGDSFLYASNNLYFNNETDALSVTADDGNNVTADPMFVDGANGDYRLLAGSPAIDAGVDVGLPYEGAAPDMGAYEGSGVLMTLYVDAAADTATADGTEAHPYPGIDLACQVAENGATILVKPGTYGNSNISAPRPSNLTIQSTDGPETTIIDGSKTADASFGIVIRAGSGWTVDGFTFINIGGVVSSGYSCGVYNDNRVGGETDTSVVNVVRNCVFKEAEIRGIWVQKGTKVLIEHNYFENTGANAVLSYGFVDFYNNTVVATDTLSPYGDNSGVYQAGDGGSDGVMTVKNNIFVDNYVGMIRAGDSFLYASNNLYFNNETDALSVTADDGNNVTADPMFVDGANGDYRLLAGSPAIDAGVDVGLPYEGAAPDMGAYEGEGITGIAENGGEIPRTFALKQNFPNPFNPTTRIEYDLPKLTHVKLIIYNSLGQEVKVLVDKHQSPGSFKVEWNGRDKYGNRLSSGFYFCRIQADGFVKTSKMLLLK